MTTRLAALILVGAAWLAITGHAQIPPPSPPNIVWIVLDDASPTLGSYGDAQAITPNMDRLAREGARFTRAYTHTPVCAPSRSGLVTGMYPTTIGSHNMRSKVVNPPETFMSLLRKAGYSVVWPGKTDFNFDTGAGVTGGVPPGAADSTTPWLGAPPPAQPFFAYINLGVTHEAQVRGAPELHRKNTRRLKPGEFHDPQKMRVPAFLPDAPEVRKDLAQYYDLVTAADYQVGDVLAWLDEHGIAGNTAVFLFSDHGTGMPRSKRWVYPSGINVPLIVRWPKQTEPGTVRDDLVAFVDFAPTVLAMAGATAPERMQGQVFLGERRAAERPYVFASRDRMDETPDRIRTVLDKRFQYIRNFHPELPYAQTIAYNEQNPSMQAWRRLHKEGKLAGAPALFFAPAKPREELYDLAEDPDTIRNLADNPRYRGELERLRAVLDKWMVDTKDLGATPEAELEKRGILKPIPPAR